MKQEIMPGYWATFEDEYCGEDIDEETRKPAESCEHLRVLHDQRRGICDLYEVSLHTPPFFEDEDTIPTFLRCAFCIFAAEETAQ